MVIAGGDEIMDTSMDKVDNVHQEIDDDDEELIIVDDDDVDNGIKGQPGIGNNNCEEEKPLDLSTKRRCPLDIQTTTSIAASRGGSVFFPINPHFNVSPLTLLPSQLPLLLCSPWTELFQAGRWLPTITPRTVDLIRQTQPLYHANSSAPAASMIFQFYNQAINNNNNNNKQFTSPIASPSSSTSSTSSSSVGSSSSSSQSSNSLLSTTSGAGGNKRKSTPNRIAAFQSRKMNEKFLHPRRHRAKNPTVRRMVANFRERCRVHMISEAFESLRVALPTACPAQKLTKVSILRIASIYILLLGAMNGRDYSADQSKPTVDQLQQLLAETIYNETNLRC
ncbi:Protein atonal -like protein 8 [Trichinella nelsoni]|uniref:Protein atonal-like protein 8 n=1 Tax=Trichinella nelsoni TaxID=6336 RepID=A0A0V0S0E8_9BILA|nr:Protein atonal -like protein 8 [Trichinella nelsoni]